MMMNYCKRQFIAHYSTFKFYLTWNSFVHGDSFVQLQVVCFAISMCNNCEGVKLETGFRNHLVEINNRLECSL
jgi:hypothetical protein